MRVNIYTKLNARSRCNVDCNTKCNYTEYRCKIHGASRERKMKALLLLLVAGMAVLLLSTAAMAAGSNTLTVTSSVTGTCKFTSATSTLNFGALDPSVGTAVDGSVTTQFWCTKGTTQTLAAGNGAHFAAGKRNMLDTGTSGDLIPYTLTLTPDGGTNGGPGSPRTLTIAGQVLGADYTGKTASTYSDSVVIDITP